MSDPVRLDGLATRTALLRSAGATLGVLADRVTPEPSNAYHPVAWLGVGLDRLERFTYHDSRRAGSAHLAVATFGTLATSQIVKRALKPLPMNELLSTALAVGVSNGSQILGTTALSISACLEAGNIEAARELLPHLVGRDPRGLDADDICRAVVESVAENTVDAATAVLVFGVFSGSSGVWLQRTINTLDAMVGYRNERYEHFGWASARSDDIANWIPARLSVFATALAAATLKGFDVPATAVVRTAFVDGRNHPSPNGGLIEAAFAASLNVTLGGTNIYEGQAEQRGFLGSGAAPTTTDIERAVALSKRTVDVMAGVSLAGCLAAAVLSKMKPRPSRRRRRS